MLPHRTPHAIRERRVDLGIRIYKGDTDAYRLVETTVVRTLKRLGTAHSLALAEALNVSRPKMTDILKRLRNSGRVETVKIIPHPDFRGQWVRVWRVLEAPVSVEVVPVPVPRAAPRQSVFGITEEDLRWMREQRERAARRKQQAQIMECRL